MGKLIFDAAIFLVVSEYISISSTLLENDDVPESATFASHCKGMIGTGTARACVDTESASRFAWETVSKKLEADSLFAYPSVGLKHRNKTRCLTIYVLELFFIAPLSCLLHFDTLTSKCIETSKYFLNIGLKNLSGR
jgi:hypothetical protein